jgi:glycosyltransferase involved in cell wall biosynthesis
MPLVSVVIPTYNRPQLVVQAIDSVLSQEGGFEFDIVVIDDGSTVETEQALQKFGAKIRYTKRANTGLNPSRNHALGLVRGEYVAFLDDDDVWLPYKTKLLVAALQQFPRAQFVHSNFFIWKPEVARQADGLSTWFSRPYAWNELYTDRMQLNLPELSERGLSAIQETYCGDLYRWSLSMPMVLPSTAIIRRDAIDSGARFPEFDSTGDWEFFARLSKERGCVFVPAETTLNRSHEDATRLTRTDPTLRMRRRVAMIHRVWRADSEFSVMHGAQIDAVEASCWRALAKMYVGRGQIADAREALRALRRLETKFRVGDAGLAALAWMPFSNLLIDTARSARRWLVRGSA